ncbi:MAG: lipid-A-disaccharide synthase [Bacteroidales bacterium]|nr:lipid-A-disaccharide synthase [Bacteroidales bacterium]
MKYYLIAGEASGDLHASNLMKGIYAQDSEADCRFWGGSLMDAVRVANQGSSGLVHDYKGDAIMGFWEVAKSAGRLSRNLRSCKEDINRFNPDAVILVDYPGFNFRIAEFAHERGFKVFYYIAPKVWASREGRIRKLKEYVDRLFIVFPFEIPYFTARGVDFIYRGNPLVDAIDDSEAAKETREEFLVRNGLENRPIIALLAGSRSGEISKMMPVLMEFTRKLRALPRYAGYQFVIAGAPSRTIDDYAPYMDPADKEVKVLFGQTQNIVRNSEVAVVNSGTASLETVLLGTPQVVGYINASRLTYLIAKKLIKVRYISLGNLILDRLAFRELIQDDCSADALVEEVKRLVEDQPYREKMLAEYAAIREALGGRGASAAVAGAMIEELQTYMRSPKM